MVDAARCNEAARIGTRPSDAFRGHRVRGDRAVMPGIDARTNEVVSLDARTEASGSSRSTRGGGGVRRWRTAFRCSGIRRRYGRCRWLCAQRLKAKPMDARHGITAPNSMSMPMECAVRSGCRGESWTAPRVIHAVLRVRMGLGHRTEKSSREIEPRNRLGHRARRSNGRMNEACRGGRHAPAWLARAS